MQIVRRFVLRRDSLVIAGGHVFRKFPNVDGEQQSRVKSRFDLPRQARPCLAVNGNLFADKLTAVDNFAANNVSHLKSFFVKISPQNTTHPVLYARSCPLECDPLTIDCLFLVYKIQHFNKFLAFRILFSQKCKTA